MWATDVIFDVGAAANAEGVRIRRVTERLSDVVSFPRRRVVRLERWKIHYVFNACDSMVLEFWIIDKSTMTKVFQIRRQTRKRLRN